MSAVAGNTPRIDAGKTNATQLPHLSFRLRLPYEHDLNHH